MSAAKEQYSEVTYLPHDGTFKHHQHEQGEETVVPVFIQNPKGDTENLENKERGSSMLAKEFGEGGDRNVELVPAIK